MTMQKFWMNGKSVKYEETPPVNQGWFRCFDVSVNDRKYLLATNNKGDVAETADHQIATDHPDVVKEIVRREFGGTTC